MLKWRGPTRFYLFKKILWHPQIIWIKCLCKDIYMFYSIPRKEPTFYALCTSSSKVDGKIVKTFFILNLFLQLKTTFKVVLDQKFRAELKGSPFVLHKPLQVKNHSAVFFKISFLKLKFTFWRFLVKRFFFSKKSKSINVMVHFRPYNSFIHCKSKNHVFLRTMILCLQTY